MAQPDVSPHSHWTRRLRWSGWLYACLLAPSLVILAHGGLTDPALLQVLDNAWRGSYWQLPGLSASITHVVLDGLRMGLIAGLTVLFWRNWQDWRHAPVDFTGGSNLDPTPSIRHVLAWTALFAVILLGVAPFQSSDLFGYINRGVLQAAYQLNPYVVPIGDLPHWQADPRFSDHWINNPNPYGFLFTSLTHWIAELGQLHPAAMFLGHKLINAVALLGTVYLVYRLGEQLQLPRPALSAYFIGCNPFVLLHTMAIGHNDILLVALLLLSLWCFVQTRWAWAALPVLTLSVLIKYASLLVGPVLVLDLIKRRQWTLLGIGIAGGLVVLGGLAAPYLTPGEPWPWKALLENAGQPQHSLVKMLSDAVRYPAKLIPGVDVAEVTQSVQHHSKQALWLAFIGFYGLMLWRFWRQPDTRPHQVIHTASWVMTVMIALVSAKFHAWYPVMFLPVLMLLAEDHRLRRFGEWLALFQMPAFTVFRNLPVISVIVMTLIPLVLAWRAHPPPKPTDRCRAKASTPTVTSPLR